MLLNRNIKRQIINQSSDKKFNNTLSVGFKSKPSTLPLNGLKQQQQSLLSFKKSLTNGINHPRIRQLILNHEHIGTLLSQSNKKSKQNIKNITTNLQLQQQRKWLTKKGKKYLIDFDDNERKQMKNCFNSMDLNNNGSIGIDELQELLLSVGLMQQREEVKKLIDSVDEDKSGKIQFSQFLKMILNDQGQNEEIVQFFKYIINFNTRKNDHAIDWKNSQSETHNNLKSLDKNNDEISSPSKKLSLIHQKQNILKSSILNKSTFQCDRNKFYTSSENSYQNEFVRQNSALNVFEKHPHPKNLPFGMIVSHIRRKHLLTALRIGEEKVDKMLKKSSLTNSAQQNPSNRYLQSSALRSSQNMKGSKASLSQFKEGYTEQEVDKGQNVMNSLRKMWDRRMLRQIRQKKNKKILDQKISRSSLTEKGKTSKSNLLNLP